MSEKGKNKNGWLCQVPKCGYKNSSSTKYCDNCDARRQDDVKNKSSSKDEVKYWKCRHCGKSNKEKYDDCGRCHKLRKEKSPETMEGEDKNSEPEDLNKYALDFDDCGGDGMTLAEKIRAMRQKAEESDCSCSCSGGTCSCEEM
uniref:RanBP2-type domain-containing protein n=1 Tax=Strongyloides papillosus TaxID=174720 RepID=A0A0N5BG70_STREA